MDGTGPAANQNQGRPAHAPLPSANLEWTALGSKVRRVRFKRTPPPPLCHSRTLKHTHTHAHTYIRLEHTVVKCVKVQMTFHAPFPAISCITLTQGSASSSSKVSKGGVASLGGVASCGGGACLGGVSDVGGVSGGSGVDRVGGAGCLGAVGMVTWGG